MVLAVAVALAVPALAWSAPMTGKYSGSFTFSVDPSLSGKPTTADVKSEGNKTTATVVTEGSKEVWTWDDKTLNQKEYDKGGKVVQEYTATLQGDKFTINCKDKAKNDCDAGIDSRNYWQVKTTPETITYLVYGVPRDKKGDASAKVEKRHEATLKLGK